MEYEAMQYWAYSLMRKVRWSICHHYGFMDETSFCLLDLASIHTLYGACVVWRSSIRPHIHRFSYLDYSIPNSHHSVTFCLPASLSVHLSVWLSVRPSVILPVCQSDCLTVHPFVCSSVCLSVHLSIRVSVCCPSVYSSVCLSFCLSVCLSVHSCFYPLVCSSTHPSSNPSIHHPILFIHSSTGIYSFNLHLFIGIHHSHIHSNACKSFCSFISANACFPVSLLAEYRYSVYSVTHSFHNCFTA